MEKGTLGRIGGLVALAGLLFLPIASCGNIQVTGYEILTRGGGDTCLWIALACSVIAFFSSSFAIHFLTGLGGLISLGIFLYQMKKDQFGEFVRLESGGILAIIGFGLQLIQGMFGEVKKK